MRNDIKLLEQVKHGSCKHIAPNGVDLWVIDSNGLIGLSRPATEQEKQLLTRFEGLCIR